MMVMMMLMMLLRFRFRLRNFTWWMRTARNDLGLTWGTLSAQTSKWRSQFISKHSTLGHVFIMVRWCLKCAQQRRNAMKVLLFFRWKRRTREASADLYVGRCQLLAARLAVDGHRQHGRKRHVFGVAGMWFWHRRYLDDPVEVLHG